MALADNYRVLGLRTGASFSDVKLAYRNLARLYHPDVNPGDQRAKEKFIQITQAYRALMESLPQQGARRWRGATRPEPVRSEPVSSGRRESSTAQQTAQQQEPQTGLQKEPQTEAAGRAADQSPTPEPKLHPMPGASAMDQQLKRASFGKLRDLFQSNRFPRAVALVEGLATRFPQDAEVRQWHAITYYRWGHDLLLSGNGPKARACLNKSLRLDPQNQSLCQAVHQDLQRLGDLRTVPVAQ
jgi:tetratricopeptide (TPR) repeat protein